MKTIAFFDFDNTITSKDSLADFIQFAVGKPSYYLGLTFLSPILFAYIFKLVPNYIAKEKLFTHFFRGWDSTRFQETGSRYSLEKLQRIIRPQAMDTIVWHQQQGHEVVIVTASMECWIKEWCTENKLELIATRHEILDGIVTGKFATKNCSGPEKVNRITAEYDLSQYKEIYAYGDSHGDKEMLDIATHPHYKFFN